MADLQAVMTFINNADAHLVFVDRVTVAVYEEALTLRETPAVPMTDEGYAAQEWALRVFGNPRVEALRMLPALTIKANDAALIDAQGEIDVTDAQVRSTVAALVGEYSTYIPAVI